VKSHWLPVKGHWLPVTQVPLENSVESHWKFGDFPLETSKTSVNDQCHGTEIFSGTWVTRARSSTPLKDGYESFWYSLFQSSKNGVRIHYIKNLEFIASKRSQYLFKQRMIPEIAAS